jgi:hypothetical protein
MSGTRYPNPADGWTAYAKRVTEQQPTAWQVAVQAVHHPATFVYASGESLFCVGCGQPWPCDASRLAQSLLTIMQSFHDTVDEARACGGSRCVAAMDALDNPQRTDVYAESTP